ncbi:MAG: molybdenum ABC transporter ATP-binding protein [Oxalobacteraceae bacterium]
MRGIQLELQLERASFRLEVQLDLPAEGFIALFGPSGCGKTTLLRSMAGLEPQVRGRVSVNGLVWQDAHRWVPPHQRSLGYVFQEASLFPHLSVRSNLAYGRRRATGTSSDEFDHLIDLLGIAPLLDRRSQSLSGGERQRVAIARALAVNPSLLLMDEPLAALDVRRKQEILPYLESLQRDLRIPVLYVTHAPDEVTRLAQHLVVLENGRVLASGSLIETLARVDLPISVADDLGTVLETTVVEIDERWKLAKLAFNGGALWTSAQGLRTGASVRIRVLARDVSIACERPAPSTIQNVLPARIAELVHDEAQGQARVLLHLGENALIARVTQRSVVDLGLHSGQAVWLQVKSVALA